MSDSVVILGGAGNSTEIASPDLVRGTISYLGTGGLVVIERGVAGNFHIEVQSGAAVRIGAESRLNGLKIHALAAGASLTIGQLCGFSGGGCILLHEAREISIGHGCLFGATIWISVSDMHSIMDVESGQRLNPAANIVIEDHVWCCDEVRINKGVRLGKNSIIGARSIVTSDIPPDSFAAGVPAAVKRSGVTWDAKLL